MQEALSRTEQVWWLLGSVASQDRMGQKLGTSFQ